MAKKIGTAIKTLGTSISTDLNEPIQIDKPDYPDKGVKYAGYSKEITSGNKYKLNPQEPFIEILNFNNIVGASTRVDSFANRPPQNKTLYITSIELNTSVTAIAIGCYIKLISNDEGDKVIFWNAPLRSETYSIVFPIPLKVFSNIPENITPKGLIVETNIPAGVTLNELTLNIHGWIE